jgi:hypothetical protein
MKAYSDKLILSHFLLRAALEFYGEPSGKHWTSLTSEEKDSYESKFMSVLPHCQLSDGVSLFILSRLKGSLEKTVSDIFEDLSKAMEEEAAKVPEAKAE